MASLFKRPTSKFWFACYRDRTGRQIRKSTKLLDKAAALKIAVELERVENLAKTGMAAVSQFQRVVSQVSKEVIGETLPSQSVEEYFAAWLPIAERRLGEISAKSYRLAVRRFLESLGPVAKNPVRSLSPVHIERFLNQRLDAGVAPKTAVEDIKVVGLALKRAERFGEIDRSPVPAVTLPKVTSSEREVFNLKEVELLVAAADHLDWQTAILISAYTGARLGDCVRMTWDNVDAATGFLRFQQKKTGKWVGVPLHKRLVEHLHHVSAHHASGPLCPYLAALPDKGSRGLSMRFNQIVLRAGLDPMIVQGKGKQKFTRRTFHSLRHGFVSVLANSGVSQEVRMRLTGHSSAGIHQRYTHLNPGSLEEAIRKIG